MARVSVYKKMRLDYTTYKGLDKSLFAEYALLIYFHLNEPPAIVLFTTFYYGNIVLVPTIRNI